MRIPYRIVMRVSKYHLVRFILDQPYGEEIHEFWSEWIKQVVRMFPKHKVPACLLQGLGRKNDCLSRICEEIESAQAAHSVQTQAEEKCHAWVLRRDAGNQRAQEKRTREKEEKRHHARALNDVYQAEMQPVWDAQLSDIQAKRDEQITKIYNV